MHVVPYVVRCTELAHNFKTKMFLTPKVPYNKDFSFVIFCHYAELHQKILRGFQDIPIMPRYVIQNNCFVTVGGVNALFAITDSPKTRIKRKN